MAIRRKTYKKRIQNRMGMILATIVVVLLIALVAIRGAYLSKVQETYSDKEKALIEAIERERQRSEEIDEFEKYSQTKKFVEEVAKDKLGLAYEDEIIFKNEE